MALAVALKGVEFRKGAFLLRSAVQLAEKILKYISYGHKVNVFYYR